MLKLTLFKARTLKEGTMISSTITLYTGSINTEQRNPGTRVSMALFK